MIGAILLQMILIMLNAVFASAEIAVISMNDARLKKLTTQGNKRAVILSDLIEQPARFLATIQVAITLAGLLGSAFAADNFAAPLVEILMKSGLGVPRHVLQSSSVFIITIILAYFSLVFGELIPKRIAMKKAESMALFLARLLDLVARIFKPFVWFLTASTNIVLRVFGINPEEEDEKVTEEEIRMLLMTGNEQGTIAVQENEMIQNVFDFNDIFVEQICTHRIEVVGIFYSDDLEAWDEVIYNSRHSYYPVFGETMDDVIGILDTKDYFRSPDRIKEKLVDYAVDTVFFIPEGMKANILFQHMQKNRKYLAVVMDEYGGMTGIITLHDLVEALMGELEDQGEEREFEEIEKLGEGRWRIQGSADLNKVEEELGVDLPTDRYGTYNGFIFGAIGRVPFDGESFEFQYQNMRIVVHDVKHHRITESTVEVIFK